MYAIKIYFVEGSKRSNEGIEKIKKYLEENFEGEYSLEEIDVLQDPESAQKNKVLATPTIVKESPEPTKKVMGDLSDVKKVVRNLGLEDDLVEE